MIISVFQTKGKPSCKLIAGLRSFNYFGLKLIFLISILPPMRLLHVMRIFFFIFCLQNVSFAKTHSYDIVIYGGSSAGVSAAIKAACAGKSVAIVETYHRPCGLTTAGYSREVHR